MTPVTQPPAIAARGATRSEQILGEALVIVHPLRAPALERSLAEALAPAIWRATASSSRFAGSEPRLCDLSAAEWRRVLHETEASDPELLRLFSARTGPAIYFGLAPLSVAFELGRRLGPTHRVLAYHEGPRPAER